MLELQNIIRLDDNAFEFIKNFVLKQTGIVINDAKKKIIEMRLSKRLRILNFDSYHKYFKLLMNNDTIIKEQEHLFDIVTVNESFFFRGGHHFDIIRELVESKPKKYFRILSAGCSTGEEPYSLKMSLYDLDKKIKIIGTDISQAAIEKARTAVYTAHSFREMNRDLIDKYFNSNGKEYFLKNEFKNDVIFLQMNLFDFKKIMPFVPFDFILCRNVLIYFNHADKVKLIKHFYDILKPGGLLLIGHSESLHKISRSFRITKINGKIVYQK